MKVLLRIKGGPNSGHHGHAGRPGKHGGSLTRSAGGGRPKGGGIRITSKGLRVLDSAADMEMKTVSAYHNHKGGGYFITNDGALASITEEFSGGTNDHPGYEQVLKDPAFFGVKQDAADKFAAAQAKLDAASSMSWDSPAYQKIDAKYQNEYEKFWGAIQENTTRVRVFDHGDDGGNYMSIQPLSWNNSTLRQIQQWHRDGLLPKNTNGFDNVYVEAWDSSGWVQTSYDSLLSAKTVNDVLQK